MLVFLKPSFIFAQNMIRIYAKKYYTKTIGVEVSLHS